MGIWQRFLINGILFLMNERIPTPANDNYKLVPDAIILPQKRETSIAVDGIEVNGPKLSEMLVTLQETAEAQPERITRELIEHAKKEIISLSKSELVTLINNSNPARWKTHPHFYQALFDRLREPPPVSE